LIVIMRALMNTLWPYFLVGLGGFVGANARFVVARGVAALFGTRFPLGTFVLNVSAVFHEGVITLERAHVFLYIAGPGETRSVLTGRNIIATTQVSAAIGFEP
jgi:fluoride ion exporter CrcB/FEX